MKTTSILALAVLLSAAALSRGQPLPPDLATAGSIALEIMTTTRDNELKWQAMRILDSLRYQKAAPQLIRLLADPHRNTRALAARALGDMRAKDAVKPLIDLLAKEQDNGVIEQTSSALLQLGAKEAVPALKAHANHESVQTRSWVLQALGRLGSRADVPFLAKYLDDPDSTVQRMAAEGIEWAMDMDFGFRSTVTVGNQGAANARAAIQKAKDWWAANKNQPASFWKQPPGG